MQDHTTGQQLRLYATDETDRSYTIMKATNTPTIPNRNGLKLLLFTSIAGLMFGTAAVQADDVEIYLTPPAVKVPPNMLFILDESGSMSSTTHDSNGNHSTRIADLRSALTTILNDSGNDNINAAIMAYTTHIYNNGPLSLRAVSGFGKIVDNRSAMVSAVNSLSARSYTPSVKALEAGVEWFRNSFTDTPYNWTVAHLGTTPQTYQSPIGDDPTGNWCRPNRMVFLTDGRPNSNRPATAGDPGHWSGHVGAFIPHYGVTAYPAPGTTSPAVGCAADPYFSDGRCSSEIVEWASTTDLKTATGWTGIQNIVTDTIGFGITENSTQEGYLMNIADRGKGEYYTVDNADKLTAAFKKIVNNATTSIPYTYSSPTIPYNPDNAAISNDFLYVPMFSPLAKSYWKGNIKKYRVGTDSNGDVFFRDRNGADVVDTSFLFITNTQDYWSSTANTGETYKGGAMSNMSSTTARRLYTWLPGSNRDLTATINTVDPAGNPVTISPNRVHKNNILITSGDVGAGSPGVRSTLLDWVNWIGDGPPPVTTPPTTNTSNDNFPQTTAPPPASDGDGLREYMGSPLHTKPQIARYRPALNFTPDTAVDAAGDTITFSQAQIWNTGDIVVYSSEGGTRLPIQGGGALSDGGEYYVVSAGSTSLQLATSAADAAAGIVIDLVDATGNTGVHSLITRIATDIVLIGTSEGVLHAFNGGTDTATTAVGDGGGELWSFMPEQFLSTISTLRDNLAANTPVYGLDGPMTVYDSGGKKYVAVTMRRGGRNVYVLDITDISKPKMAWEIIGGTTTGFSRLGQTWSEPQFLRMELNGAAARDVLVFGGGYDNTTQDHDTSG
ncbi:MAG TPA: hypothetical protein ENI62_07885, partial [Gammaproteobacteria bacterium]|nr:hypothetical protein [Gammaproteobacteria bacterium]